MKVELVKTTTSDGIRLDGAWAENESRPATGPTAVICLHGVGSNFYGASLLEDLQSPLLAAGLSVLRVNTRGHDGFYTAFLPSGPRRLGAAYETVDEARIDVAAWVDFLVRRGHERVVLLGHSLGAIKTLYVLAHEPSPAVQGAIVMSPPRLSEQAFQNSPESPRYFEAITAAREHVAAGRKDMLIEVRFPFPMLITAGGYLDKYGPGERYNFLAFAERIACPVVFVYGGQELENGGIAFAGLPDAVGELARRGKPFAVRVISAADHNYTGQRSVLGAELARWVDATR